MHENKEPDYVSLTVEHSLEKFPLGAKTTIKAPDVATLRELVKELFRDVNSAMAQLEATEGKPNA